ncbi:MAG: UDP-glucose 4-epimerase GalE [Planctomycetota bacterium]|jgi:UDP-glucose 4-epimerase|nr:UDP-glucose 4-epimerase GalE [Planctomycetota bacterium]
MAVLVVGGAGYIGSHTVFALADGGRKVAIVDNLLTGHAEAVHPGAPFFLGDIRDADFMERVFAEVRVEAVIHFAASSQVGESVAKPLAYYNNNLYGTMALLDAMTRHNVDKIVFSSTAAAYGEPERVPILENDRTGPTSPYGETKLAMERMMKWVAGAGGPRYVSLRYFNAGGAREDGTIGEDHRPETHLIPIVLQVANGRRESAAIFGDDYDTPDGTCIRDYIHVSDLAQAHILALEHLERGGGSEIFNLGNGAGFSVRQVIEAAEAATGKSIPHTVSARRSGDPARLVASNAKAARGLGFKPATPDLRDIIASAWKWHRTHPDGFGAKLA